MALIYEVNAEKKCLTWAKSLLKTLGQDFTPTDWWTAKSWLVVMEGFVVEFDCKTNPYRKLEFEFQREGRFARFLYARVDGGEIYYRLHGGSWISKPDPVESEETD